MLNLKSDEQLNAALGFILRTKDAEKVISGTQNVLEVTDSTDLEAEAYFDINSYILENGLFDTRDLINNEETPPSFVLWDELSDRYSVPKHVEMGN